VPAKFFHLLTATHAIRSTCHSPPQLRAVSVPVLPEAPNRQNIFFKCSAKAKQTPRSPPPSSRPHSIYPLTAVSRAKRCRSAFHADPCIDGRQAVQLVRGRKRELAVADVFGLSKFGKYSGFTSLT
jgi:hypothetical protein